MVGSARELCYIAAPMAYTVLARKYRPQTFADLVGQEHVTRTLSNAITSGRVAHAFLFTGVRGVGKTTTARIVAKALNCEKGPTPEPCGVCDPCRDITAGRDTDVLEMDGASNNSVEDVRRLQESIPYRPTRDRFKIVIVDEVHMLSTGAFNAFLKTLEEPPPHVKFIFATTEVHKVPVTIRSRCQRYDFRMIPQTIVSQRVREILGTEGIRADDAAVAIVAQEAAGSMRDALTLLDQIVAFGGESLVGEEVARVLGIADREVLHRVARAVLEGDGADVLRAVDELASRGLDMLHFSKQLLELVRDMVVLRVCGADTDLVALVQEERARARAVGERAELAELERAFSALSKVVEDVAQSGTPRTTLEMGLVRLATRPPLRPLAELVARLEELERRAGGGGGGGGARRGGPATGGGGQRPTSGAQAKTEERTSAVAASAPPDRVPPASSMSSGRETRRSQEDKKTIEAAAPSASSSPGKIVEQQAAPAIAAKVSPAPLGEPRQHGSVEAAVEDRRAIDLVSAADDPIEARAAWARIVARLLDDKPALGAVLQHGVPAEITRDKIVLAFSTGSFFGRQAESESGRNAIAEVASRILGARPRVEVTYVDGTLTDKTLAEEAAEARESRIAATRERALRHPLVIEAQKLFDLPEERVTVRVELE